MSRAFLVVTGALMVILMIAGGSIAGSYALTLHQIRIDQAAHQQQQTRQAITGCRQFQSLVTATADANNATRHAVAASRSFGQLFTQALERYWAQSGCVKILGHRTSS